MTRAEWVDRTGNEAAANVDAVAEGLRGLREDAARRLIRLAVLVAEDLDTRGYQPAGLVALLAAQHEWALRELDRVVAEHRALAAQLHPGQRARYCGHSGCNETFPVAIRRGRPQIYCSRRCRDAARRAEMAS